MACSRGLHSASRGNSFRGRVTGLAAGRGQGRSQVSMKAAAVDINNPSDVASPSATRGKAPEWVGKPWDSFLEGIDGWMKRIFWRGDGTRLDSYWYSPSGHKFWSKTEVKNFLEILGENNGDEEAAYQKLKSIAAAKRATVPVSGRHGHQGRTPCSNRACQPRGCGGRLSARSGWQGQQRGGVCKNDKQQQQKQPQKNIETEGDDQGPIQPPSPWRNSKAKKKLKEQLKDESSWVQVCDPYHVFCADDDFKQYKENNFINNFNSLKEKIETKKCAVEFDKHWYEQDQILYPASAINKRGDKRYEGSEAERQLKQDVIAGRSKGRAPKEMWISNPAYHQNSLTLKQFWSHKYQEERALKEKVYWQKKRNEKGKKDHDKEVAKMDD